jgi:hypothetical protein
VSNVVIAAGTSTGSFYFRDNVVGSRTLTAQATGLTQTQQSETINPAAASKLVITSAAQTRLAGQCSLQVTVTSQDPFNNPANLSAGVAANLTASTGSLVFYSDVGCATPITSVTFPGATSTRTFYFRETLAGTTNITATASGLAPGSQPEVITPGPGAKLSYTTAPQTVLESFCSGITTVQVQDSFNNASPVGGSTQVSLSSGSSTLAFFSDPSCSTQVTFVTVASGGTTASFYFKDSTVGNPTVNVTASGLGTSPQIETINPAVPTKLVMITPARTVLAGACSGVVTVQSQNNSSVASNVQSNTTATLTSTSVTTFYSDSGCTTAVTSVTLAAGTNTANFYFRDNTAGNPVLTATPPVLAPGSQTQTITPANAFALVFSNNPITVVAGVCSTAATLQVRDGFGNDTTVGSNTVVSLSSPVLTFFTDSGCTASTTSVTIASGSGLQNLYFRGTVAGVTTASGSGGTLQPANQSETVTAANPSALFITGTPQTVVAGTCSAVVTVQTRDTFGNVSNVTGSPLTVNLSGMTYYSDSGCNTVVTTRSIPVGSSAATFYFKDNAAGPKTITAQAGGYTQGTQSATISAANPTRLVFTTGGQTARAGNCSASAVSLQTQDTFGNVANVTAVTTVSLTPSTGTLTFYSDAACNTAITNLSYAIGSNTRTFYFKGTLVGSPTVTAAATNYNSPVQTETITANDPNKLVFTNTAITVGTGACSGAMVVRTQDFYGNFANVTAATPVNLSVSGGTLTFYSDSGCNSVITSITIPINTSTAPNVYVKSNSAGTPLARAQVSGLTDGTQTVTVSSGGPVKLAFTTAPLTATAGACSSSAVAIQTRDAFDNPANVTSNTQVNLGASTMQFYAAAGCGGSPITFVTVLSGQNAASFYFRENTSGSRRIDLTASSYSGAFQDQNINPGVANALIFTNPPLTTVAGNCSGTNSIQVKDAFGNNTTVGGNTTVTMSSGSGALNWFSDSGCNTPATTFQILTGGGTGTAYYRSTQAGATTTIANAPSLTAANLGTTVTAANPTVLAFSTGPVTATAGGCGGMITIQTRDVHGNPSNVLSNLSVTLSASTATFYADPGCGSSIGTTLTVLANQNTASFYFRDTVSGSRTINIAAIGYTGSGQAETVNPGSPNKLAFTTTAQTLLASACSSAVTVQTRDTFDNPTTAGATVTFTLGATATDASTTFYSEASCSTTATQVVIPNGQHSGTLYFKSRTGNGTATITVASSGLTGTNQSQTVRASTRTGTCNILAGNATSNTGCTISPALFVANRTILFFQATAGAGNAEDTNVRCYLNSTSLITCDRAGTSNNIAIRWYTMEFPDVASSPRVRHQQASCLGALTNVTLTDPVTSVGDSFVLFSATRAGSNGQYAFSSHAVELTTTSNVRVEYNSPGNCGTDQYAIQVVEYPGANVAVGKLFGQNSFQTSPSLNPTVDLTRTFVVLSSRSGDDPICSRAIRASLLTNNTVSLNRAITGTCTNAAAIDEIVYQRVELPVGNLVQQMPMTMTAGTPSSSVSITTPVDITRSVMFASGMFTGGTAQGETASPTENVGESLGRFSFTTNNATVNRDSSLSAATFTGYVVQFQP